VFPPVILSSSVPFLGSSVYVRRSTIIHPARCVCIQSAIHLCTIFWSCNRKPFHSLPDSYQRKYLLNCLLTCLLRSAHLLSINLLLCVILRVWVYFSNNNTVPATIAVDTSVAHSLHYKIIIFYPTPLPRYLIVSQTWLGPCNCVKPGQMHSMLGIGDVCS
jgi:hypothetical protein